MRAAAIELEPVRADPPAGPPLDVVHGRDDALVADVRHATAAFADDVMVMATWAAGHVGVLAGGEIDPLEDLELGQQVEDAEDRRPADPEASHPGVLDEVCGREMAFTRGDEVGHHAPRLRQAVAGGIHRLDERRRPASSHTTIRRRFRDHVSDGTRRNRVLASR